MQIKKVETVTHQGSSKLNEDCLLVSDKVFGVFDGATELVQSNTGDFTGGYIASNLVKEVFSKSEDTLHNLTVDANNEIRSKSISFGIDYSDKLSLFGTAMAAVKLESDSFNWVQIGDCPILVIFEDDTYKLLVDDFEHDFHIYKLLEQKRNDGNFEPPRQILRTEIEQNRKSANVEYGILNGEPEALKFVKEGKHTLANVKNIILFTDGLIFPSSTVEPQPNFDLFVKTFLESGLEGLKAHVRELENSDPEIKSFMRVKPQDDIAAIALYF